MFPPQLQTFSGRSRMSTSGSSIPSIADSSDNFSLGCELLLFLASVAPALLTPPDADSVLPC